MTRAWLLHWNEAEAPERIARLEAAGFAARYAPGGGGALLAKLRRDPPDVVVIDLSRLPSHGREMGAALRRSPATRQVPLVFLDGAPEKVAKVKATLPDAVFATWREVRGAVRRALRTGGEHVVVPRAYMQRFAGRPLAKKLGLKEGARIGLLGAPANAAAILGALPEDAVLVKGARGACDPILLFATSRRDLTRRLAGVVRRADLGGLWIAWPKKASGLASDLDPASVRQAGLDAGLVDHKICAIDGTWSGLRFVRRQ